MIQYHVYITRRLSLSQGTFVSGQPIIACKRNRISSFSFRCVEPAEVFRVLMGVKSNTVDLDGLSIPYFLIRHTYFLTTSSTFLTAWKQAKIMPEFLEGNDFIEESQSGF